jgi:hypothetical protein
VSAVVQLLEFCPLRPEVLCALLDGTSRPPGSFWFRGLAAAATKKAEALCHGGQTGAVLFGGSHCVGLDTQAGNVGETCNNVR